MSRTVPMRRPTASCSQCLHWGMCAMLLGPMLVSMTSAAVPVWDQPGSIPFATSRVSSVASTLLRAGEAVSLVSGVPEEKEWSGVPEEREWSSVPEEREWSGAAVASARGDATERRTSTYESSLELAGARFEDNDAPARTSQAAHAPHDSPKDGIAVARTSAAVSHAADEANEGNVGPTAVAEAFGAERALKLVEQARELMEDESLEEVEVVDPSSTAGGGNPISTDSGISTDGSISTDSSISTGSSISTESSADSSTARSTSTESSSRSTTVSAEDGTEDDRDRDVVLVSTVEAEWRAMGIPEALPPRKLRPFWTSQWNTAHSAIPLHPGSDRNGQHLVWFRIAQGQAQAILSWVLRLTVAHEIDPWESAASAERADPVEASNRYFYKKKDGAAAAAAAAAAAGMRKASARTEASSGQLPGTQGSQLGKSWGVYMDEVSN